MNKAATYIACAALLMVPPAAGHHNIGHTGGPGMGCEAPPEEGSEQAANQTSERGASSHCIRAGDAEASYGDGNATVASRSTEANGGESCDGGWLRIGLGYPFIWFRPECLPIG